MSKDDVVYFLEEVWPEIRAKKGLPESAQPTNQDIADYLGGISDSIQSASEDR